LVLSVVIINQRRPLFRAHKSETSPSPCPFSVPETSPFLCFRIAQMGQIDEVDILGCLAAIELVLSEMGEDVVLGSAVAAAMQAIHSVDVP